MENRLLYADYLNNKGRPVHKMRHYFAAYERHFGRFVGHPVSFLEIGAGDGGSSQMWKRWLGPLARVVTIDVNPICKQFEDEQVSVRIGEPSNPIFLQELIDEFGVFDIVVDDGTHQMAHVLSAITYLYPRISPSGVYMVEDVHTAYWDDYGGGLDRPDTIVSFFKDAVDRLNADHVRDGNLVPDGFTRSTFSISAYDSILVFEKAAFVNKYNLIIGDPSLRINC